MIACTLVDGLFEVTERIYQVRGLDLSNMTIVEGDTGVLVIDPLISAECSEAGLGLCRQHRGERPVRGLLYTHSHVDHFGGARGVISAEEVAAGRVPVLAPAGFLEHAVSENVTPRHGVLTDRRGAPVGSVDAVVRIERLALNEVIAGLATLEAIAAGGRLAIEGDQAKLGELLGLLDPPDPNFAIVTP